MTVCVDSDITHSSGQVHLPILKFSEKTSIVASLPSLLPTLAWSGETTFLTSGYDSALVSRGPLATRNPSTAVASALRPESQLVFTVLFPRLGSL